MKPFIVACLAAFASACGNQTSVPSAPLSPSEPSTTVPPLYRVSGVVVENTPQGVQAIPGAAVNLWVDGGNYGYSYWWEYGPVHADAAGNFQLANLPSATGWLEAWRDGYVQQCALPLIRFDTNANLEVSLVDRTHLSADVSSVPLSAKGRIVAGRILEETASGTRPVAGAFIDFEPFPDFPAAITYSDADGRYLLCGMPEMQAALIGVGRGSAVKYVSIPPDQSLGVDIVLPN